MTKDQFLKNLEKALLRLIVERLFNDLDEAKKAALKLDVKEFIRERAETYSLPELKETFVSAQVAIGLFLEYQSAKAICESDGEKPQNLEQEIKSLLNTGECVSRRPVFPADNWREPLTGMAFVWVPGGAFQMGSGPWDDQGLGDEKPVHEAWLDGFWIGKYPVTVSQYLVFVTEAAKYEPAWLEQGSPYNIHTGEDDTFRSLEESITGDSYPIVGISWADAVAYCDWISEKTGHFFRLPTEAEWEYAARSGGREEKYAGGGAVDTVAWYGDNSNGSAHPVGTKAANGLGIFDMCGNVSEWCLDFYHKAAYGSHQPYNPQATEKSRARVARGGSWNYGARDVRCADRGLFNPDYRGCDLGFRLIRTP